MNHTSFFFSSRRRHTRCSRDWSSDVCSSDLPLLLVLYVSGHRWSPVEPARAFVALANYGHVIRDPLVWSALGRTLLYALYVPASLTLALGLAVVIGRGGSGAAAPSLRALFLLPYASSVVAVALVWQW